MASPNGLSVDQWLLQSFDGCTNAAFGKIRELADSFKGGGDGTRLNGGDRPFHLTFIGGEFSQVVNGWHDKGSSDIATVGVEVVGPKL